jgi:hypothetical protein
MQTYSIIILGLPKLHGTKPAKLHKFYEKLASYVQTLETLGKLKEIGGLYVDRWISYRPLDRIWFALMINDSSRGLYS